MFAVSAPAVLIEVDAARFVTDTVFAVIDAPVLKPPACNCPVTTTEFAVRVPGLIRDDAVSVALVVMPVAVSGPATNITAAETPPVAVRLVADNDCAVSPVAVIAPLASKLPTVSVPEKDRLPQVSGPAHDTDALRTSPVTSAVFADRAPSISIDTLLIAGEVSNPCTAVVVVGEPMLTADDGPITTLSWTLSTASLVTPAERSRSTPSPRSMNSCDLLSDCRTSDGFGAAIVSDVAFSPLKLKFCPETTIPFELKASVELPLGSTKTRLLVRSPPDTVMLLTDTLPSKAYV